MTVTELEADAPRVATGRIAGYRVRVETLALLLPAGLLLGLGAVLTGYVRGDQLLPGERAVAQRLGSIENRFVLGVSEVLDFISEAEVAPVLFVILLPVIWLSWGRAALILFGVSGSLTGLTRIISLADRARPTDDIHFGDAVKVPGIYPSGHVVYGVLVFGMIAYLAYKHMKPGLKRTLLIWTMISAAVLMGPSRVVELDHWPADAVGSYLLSLPFLLVLIWIHRHPTSQPGGRLFGVAVRARGVEDAVRKRLLSGWH